MKAALLSHLASPSAPTGAERSLAFLASGLAGRGHQTSVAVPGRWALTEELEAAGVPVATLPVRPCWLVQYGRQPLWRQTARALRYAMPDRGTGRLRAWLSGIDPDVVHVNCLPHLRGATTARSLGLPVVWHLREMLPPGWRRRWFANHVRDAATRVVAVSEAVAGWVREEGLAERVDVVHNGVAPPTHVADREAVRGRLNLPLDAVVVGYFGQLVFHKGPLDLVHAAHGAAAENSRLHFLIAGDGSASFVRTVRREIAGGTAAGRIRLIPPRPEIWDLLEAVDIVALTTLWPDPLPRAVMEAMAAGKPVVAYSGGGVPEMVVDGETGQLCRPGSVAQLSRAILELAGDESLRARLGAAGRRRAAHLFSVERHLDRMESVLKAASAGG